MDYVRRWLGSITLLVMLVHVAQAGGPPPMFALVDKVIISGASSQPQRIQIWGTFVRTAGPAEMEFQTPQYGYLHLTASDDANCAREWQLWQSAAGTGKIVAVGSCHSAGDFHTYPIHSKNEPIGEPDEVYQAGQLEQAGDFFVPDAMFQWEMVREPLEALRKMGIPKLTAIAPADDEPSPLVVHEWGTFTTFAGSNGIHLDFRPFAEQQSDLPAFVADRSNASGSWFQKRLLRSKVRMETPVLFFYTARECDVNVSVGFPKGLITEFYPPVHSIEPPFDSQAATTTGEPVGNSRIDWGQVHLIPASQLNPPIESSVTRQAVHERLLAGLLPPAANFPHYHEARKTDAALVHWRSELGDDHLERFLFYRGVGNFDLPLHLTADHRGNIQVENRGNDTVRGLFLIRVDAEDSTIKMSHASRLEANSQQTMPAPDVASLEEVMTAFKESLVAEGLYTAEASSMLESWRDSWFREPGTRLFYLVPQAWTDSLLPLQIEPTPEKAVRVLVARSEIMTSADELRLLQELAATAKIPAESRSVSPTFLQWGRLAEPALTRLGQLTKDELIRAEIERVRLELQD